MLGKVAAEQASTAVTWNQNTMVIIWAGAVDDEELYSYASTYDEVRGAKKHKIFGKI